MALTSSADSPEPSISDGSLYFKLQTTTHGGRSLFATSDIPAGTWIHSCDAPFAYVIYKDYRKEVCAHCFAYSASDYAPPTVGSSRIWSIKWSRSGAATAWFCSEDCKENWEQCEASTLLMEVDALLTKSQAASRKRFKSPEEEVKVKSMLPTFGLGDTSITQKVIDGAWQRAEALVASKAQVTLYCSTLHIEDMELEIARSLAAAIVRRYYDERPPASDPTLQTCKGSRSWAQLLDLQTNELCSIQTRPHMLTAYLRIYVFLFNALPRNLRKYMTTVREVLARDTGNAFGIWDGDRRDEMMGWGIWVSASYFNHSTSVAVQSGQLKLTATVIGCTPNVQKRRVGKAHHFEAVRSVRAGEELCISYIDTDSPVDQRRRELEESWFFTCRCVRCERETTRA